MKFILLISLIFISGCATEYKTSLVDPAASKTLNITKSNDNKLNKPQLDHEDRLKIESALNEVLLFCQPKLSGFETESARQARNAYWLSMSGLVAGSVIAPALAASSAAANASWIAGLSGWAGATNFAGQALKTSGLSGSTIAQTRNTIIANVRDAIIIASDGSKSFDDRKDALMRARAECTIYQIAIPNIPDGS